MPRKNKHEKITVAHSNESRILYWGFGMLFLLLVVSLVGWYYQTSSYPVHYQELRELLTKYKLDGGRNLSNIEIIYSLILKYHGLEKFNVEDWLWILDYGKDNSLLVSACIELFKDVRTENRAVNYSIRLLDGLLDEKEYNRLLDSLTQYFIYKGDIENGILYLQKGIAHSSNKRMKGRWYGYLLQELILQENYPEAVLLSRECISTLSTDNPLEFPFFCYHQLASLYDFQSRFKEAQDLYLLEYSMGVKQWPNRNGEICKNPKHHPISLESFRNDIEINNRVFIYDMLPYELLKHLRHKCSKQEWPFAYTNNTIVEWKEHPSFEMRCISKSEKHAIMYKLHNITVLGRNKWIFEYNSGEHDCILHSFSFPYGNSLAIPRYSGSHSVSWNSLPLKRIKRAIIPHFVDYNYYHLTIEVLGQLILSIQQAEFQNSDFVILLTPTPAAYDLLEITGFLQHVELYQWERFRYQIDEAYIVDWKFTESEIELHPIHDPQDFYIPPAPVIHLVQKFIFQGLNPDIQKTKQDTVIFIHRDEESPRSFTNSEIIYNAVRDVVETKGYNFVVHKDVDSVLSQIELFSRAKIVIGSHGAGLSNILYCSPGTSVIEIVTHPPKVSVYSRLCSILNLPYWIVAPYSLFHYGKQQSMPLEIIDSLQKTIFHILEINHHI